MVKYESIIPINFIRNEKLEKSAQFLVINNSFLYEFLIRCTFQSTKSIETAGVCFTPKGPQFIYNPEFVNSLDDEQVNFLIIHEMMHLISNHISRANRMGFDHEKANIAADMIINTTIINDYSHKTKKPSESIYEIPKDYNGLEILEALYKWNEENSQDEKKGKGSSSKDGKGSGKGSSSGSGKGSSSGSGKGSSSGSGNESQEGQSGNDSDQKGSKVNGSSTKQSPKSFDEHIESTVPEAFQEEFVKSVINEARLKGILSGNSEKLINTLYKTKTNYLKKIKLAASGLLGTHQVGTYARYNRRNPMLKGRRKEGNMINAIVDSSGSMSGAFSSKNSDFEKVLGILFKQEVTINLIMIDSNINLVKTIKSYKELQKLTQKGCGGTNLQPAIDLVNEKFSKNPTILLSDGYVDTLNFSNHKKQALVVCTQKLPEIVGKNVKSFIIPKE